MTKPFEQFPIRVKDGIDYRSYLCRECYNASQLGRRPSIARPGYIPPYKPRFDPQLGVEVKICRKCDIEKPLTEFGWQRGKRRGICKTCSIAAQRAAYAANPEKYRSAALEWARSNPEKVKAKRIAFRERDPEGMRAYWRASHARHKEHRNDYDRQRRLQPGWYKENYQRRRDRILTNLALRAEAIRNGQVIDREAIIERDKSTCYLCRRVLMPEEITLDHVVPITRGGLHVAANLHVACRPCNARKGNHLLEELSWA